MGLFGLLGADDGPGEIVLVRHGESVGNVASAEANERGHERLDLSERDADVELSETGRRQADAVGRWLARGEHVPHPTIVLSSPYRRAAETAQRAVATLGIEVVYDERLRERDLGVFDGLTGAGIRAGYPEEAQRRRKVGKFYYQPPSGESWADVVLRVRSLLADLRHGFDGARVWMFTHQAVIMSFRYVIEGMSERDILEIEMSSVGNASMTTYRRHQGRMGPTMELVSFADTTAVDEADATVTHEDTQRGQGDDAED